MVPSPILLLFFTRSAELTPELQATRGTLGREEPEDSRAHVGWKADTSAAHRPEERPWMSMKEQQPYFSHWQDEEA